MFETSEQIVAATTELALAFEREGNRQTARDLHEGLASLNGLTDGWALLLQAVRDAEAHESSLTASERRQLKALHDHCHYAVYRRKRLHLPFFSKF